MMDWLVIALGVIIVPGVVSLLLVRRHGPTMGIVILVVLLVWMAGTYFAAQDGRNIPIQPEIFGGQTIAHAHVGGVRDMAWTVFVLGPASLWAAIALLIGWASHRNANRKGEHP